MVDEKSEDGEIADERESRGSSIARGRLSVLLSEEHGLYALICLESCIAAVPVCHVTAFVSVTSHRNYSVRARRDVDRWVVVNHLLSHTTHLLTHFSTIYIYPTTNPLTNKYRSKTNTKV
ncbi:hypothetical protein BDV95DRAFT_559434 [Massariosphaeria phaeospora]|uniref:Uncharacterized protein n=1 Tax=Massariosphaeria phaeospora TaxID=100035 RepID=A0A7C8IIN4_9PLEO|nr:hypothetical protein BDV95DRAFT_559434 [Massariosphaeria phaeospora]